LTSAIDARGSSRRGNHLVDTDGLDLFSESHRHPDLRRQQRNHAGERVVEHPDDRELLTANAEALAEHAGVGPELALPVSIRQNDGSRCRRGVVCGLKCSPQARSDPERREVVAGDDFAEHQARAVAAADAGKHRRVAGEVGKDVGVLLIVEDVREGIARIGVAVGATRVDIHEARGLPDRKRSQEQRVDHGKDCCVETDSDSERQDCDERESRALDKPAQGVARVLNQGVEHDELYVRASPNVRDRAT
jgi:hypothetical protein